jgi:A/G-specific adenine glycosylase
LRLPELCQSSLLSFRLFGETMSRVDYFSTIDPDAFRQALADWYRNVRRPLPWRISPSLYGTVVSELMAQQTQIGTMLPYYARWLKRFPDFETLAAAPAEDVLKHWEGLGYYRRARHLHLLAQTYVRMEKKPQTAEEWEEMPGIGPYTAAAVSSIALGYPAAVVDGNVVRILARLTNDGRTFSCNAEAVKAFVPLADALLDRERPGPHNEAMMELGATVCVRGKPQCGVCPVTEFCRGAAHDAAESLPRIRRTSVEKIEIDRVLCVRAGALLLHRIPDGANRLAGQYELPTADKLGWKPTGKPVASRMRSITHYRIRETIYRLPEAMPPQGKLPPELHWVQINELDSLTLSGPHRRWIRELLTLPA